MAADSSYDEFARKMLPAVKKASELARSLEGSVVNSPKSEEETAVKQAMTAADSACQEVMLEALIALFPDVALSAEEETPSVQCFPETSVARVIIDPIDGTLHSYLEGNGPYAVIVGLAIERVVCAGLVALPREGLLFSASKGHGACMQRAGGPTRPARLDPAGGRILVSHGMPDGVAEYLRDQGFEVVYSCGGAVAVAPLIPGVRAGLRYASADLGVSIRGRAGVVIAREAGALVRGDRGFDFPKDLDTPSNTLRIATCDADLKLLDRALLEAGIGEMNS